MDDLQEKLASILNDPESMEKVRNMAAGLLGDSAAESPAPEASVAPKPQLPDLSSLADFSELASIVPLISKIKGGGDDDRTRLLTALKPHLSAERQKRADTAIKLLRVIDMLPVLKQNGLLDKLF